MRCPRCKSYLKQIDNCWVCEKCNYFCSEDQFAKHIRDELQFWREQNAEMTVGQKSLFKYNNFTNVSTFLFGMYPQTLVEDKGLIEKLNNLFDGFSKWKSMNFYIKGKKTDCLLFQDVEYDNKKYRGVIIKEYRPYWCMLPSDDTTSFQCVNGYKKNTVYWFIYEPIKWQMLSSDEDNVLLCSTKILDCTCVNNNDDEIHDNGTIIYPNNWEYCELRNWLHTCFFKNAFDDAEQSNIIPHQNDNSNTGVWDDQYSKSQNETQDFVFLMSYKDVLNPEYGFDKDYFSECSFRRKQGTDYAKCMGLWVDDGIEKSSVWWLRSPGNHSCRTIGIGPKGNLSICGGNVYDTDYGVVPAIYIKKGIVADVKISKTTMGDKMIKAFLGQYPQSRVYDNELCEELSYVSGNPMCSDLWKFFDDCHNMKYIDIDYCGTQFRGVYIINYRPYYAQPEYEINNSFQLSNGYKKEEIYWFIYSDIEWELLRKGEYIIAQSTMLLDCIYFNYITGHDDNEWGKSHLCGWIKTEFLKTAFKKNNGFGDIVDVKIPTINDVTSSVYGYKPNGNMFDERRIKTCTEYAKCRGIYINDAFKTKHQKKSGFWWLSDKGTADNKVAFVNENGIVCSNGLLPNSASCGVLPQITMKRDIK